MWFELPRFPFRGIIDGQFYQPVALGRVILRKHHLSQPPDHGGIMLALLSMIRSVFITEPSKGGAR